MSNSTLEHNMDQVFTHWPISEEPKQDFELYQPGKQESEGSKQMLTGGKSASVRTFKNRPGDSENVTFTPIDRIPHSHFYYYFNALGDRVMSQLTLPCQAIFFALFRRAHGFNRNWCQMSLPQLERKTGASRNTIRKHIKTLIEEGWVCILSDGYHEATTYGLRLPVDIKEKLAEKGGGPPPEPARPPDSNTSIAEADGSPEIGDQNLIAGGSKTDRQKLPPCTSSTCNKQSIGEIPDSHLKEYTSVRTDSTPEPMGENRVTDNQNDKKNRESLPSTKPDLEQSYLKSLSGKKVGEIYRAQDAWDEILGPDTRPTAAKLNQMLEYMRGWYRGDTLDTKFRWCLSDTKKKRPRDAVAWLISALKHGRYPNIVMSKSRWEGTGSSSLESKPSRTPSINNPGEATDGQSRLDRPEQTREATVEREKRRAASPHRDVWEKVLKDIGEKILPQSYESWFKPLFIAEITDTAIVFDAPDQMVADWVEENYTGLLKTTLKTVGLLDRAIAIEHLKT
ncbi:hypothetical protein F4Y93_00730 [Candidatus Poribacteria bacterium]|nr:hypothetical protein [Candidatus Poribacteria bacterium]MYF38273.1 hypothetical protein [Gammaproteobacteria bacterium]